MDRTRAVPPNAAAPAVTVGTGETGFVPINDGQTLKVVEGPQCGHHLFIGVEMKNLKQYGSTTTITAVQPGTAIEGPRTDFVFAYGKGAGAGCTLGGLPYQLDNGAVDYLRFLGQPLDVTVTVTDANGSRASGTAHVVVDSTIVPGPGVCR